MSPKTEALLQSQGLTRHFGGLPALDDVHFAIRPGEILGLIGPNGAGKSTLLNLLCGITRPTRGRMLLHGRDVTGLKPHQMVRHGVARVLQTPRSFRSLTLLENVTLGAQFGGRDPAAAAADRHDPEFCLELVGLLPKKDDMLDRLTLQEMRQLELARALATRPRLLLLDEAMSGLNPSEMARAMGLIRRIRDELDVAVIWVEHVMKAVMEVVDSLVVLNFGKVIATGTPNEVARDQAVIDAYLGHAQ